MKILGIIPSRYASSRFPGKPLVDIAGKSMIQRVYQQASLSKSLSEVVVATDDERIYSHVQNFGGKVMMTSDTHSTGTERCAEIVEKMAGEWDLVINIQGDEPFISPDQIDNVASAFEDSNIHIATLAKRISQLAELESPHVVKVIFSISGMAIYFSRFPIPFLRNVEKNQEVLQTQHFYKHIGLYAYRPEMLKKIIQLAPSSLESAESLEQLRWIENGLGIKVELTNLDSFGIDTPEDLLKIDQKFLR